MKNGNVQYLITLSYLSADVPVALFDTRAGVDAFIRTNRPRPVDPLVDDDRDPLSVAVRVFPSETGNSVFGYRVFELVGGVPARCFDRRWLVDGNWPSNGEYGGLTFAEVADMHDEEVNSPWEQALVVPQPEVPAQSNQEEWDLGGEGGA